VKEALILLAITLAGPFAVFGAGVGAYLLMSRKFLNGRAR
jgi:hypothetical protein